VLTNSASILSLVAPQTDGAFVALRDRSLRRPDGRIVAWAEVGPEDGHPIVSFPGTPTSRFAIRSDLRAYLDRDVRMIITERPGFGASTRLPAHGFLEPADDVAAILDDLAVERANLWGGSGGAPYLLAFAQRHGDRAVAATIVSGSVQLADDEIDDTIPMNAEFSRAALTGDVERLRELAAVHREAILADPLAGFRAVMDSAPEADRRVMADAGWQIDLITIARESLRQGVDGWVDELIALRTRWDEITPETNTIDITWWHGEADRNVPMTAARRFLARLPNARLVEFREAGHLEAYRRHAEILDELLARP
jgi:pimeloyl-ACP methyl ester carboxylesterase